MRKSSIFLAVIGGILVLIVAGILLLPQAGMAVMNVMKTGKLGMFFEPHTVMMLDKSVEMLERYKTDKGNYPINLESVKDHLSEGEVFINGDFMGPMNFGEKLRPFYYERLDEGNAYYLFGIGLDGEPFTEDDVYPGEGAVETSAGFKKPSHGA